MSSNIRLNRICGHCGKDFIARTTVTQYCGDICAKRAYKVKGRTTRIEASKRETKAQFIKMIGDKELLTVREAAALLDCSFRSVYYYVQAGTIKATNIGQRLTRIHRDEIKRLTGSK